MDDNFRYLKYFSVFCNEKVFLIIVQNIHIIEIFVYQGLAYVYAYSKKT